MAAKKSTPKSKLEHPPAGVAEAPRGVTGSPPSAAEEAETLADEVFEFVRAIDHYKRAQGRPFPSWSEVLDVLKSLGYERRGAEPASNAGTSSSGSASQRS